MTEAETDLVAAVDALLDRPRDLPDPAERRRLRKADGLTQQQVAATMRVSRTTLNAWETGRSWPTGARRTAYAHFLRRLADLYPATPTEQETPR
ncbi:helix-turn-helix transcriptional regulator [Streptomyces sp. YIM 98790]|uniref:helix-turn-helix domain-containing protein n=1 Tax=Streptomyces sp. YIM 98790 TaxID=2689077 RepID=UPI0014096FBB|nr:helix-turn-helix transcriptional regulator [Streptomyces sp. YIM 98790]